jgi:hypothetical protein
MYVRPTNWDTWCGVYFVPSGPFKGGIFRFEINWNSSSKNPRVHFQTNVYHPLIHPTTLELSYHQVLHAFPSIFPRKISAGENPVKVVQLLWFIKLILSDAFFENIKNPPIKPLSKAIEVLPLERAMCANVDSWDKLVSSPNEFQSEVTQNVEKSCSSSQLYKKQASGNPIIFLELDGKIGKSPRHLTSMQINP